MNLLVQCAGIACDAAHCVQHLLRENRAHLTLAVRVRRSIQTSSLQACGHEADQEGEDRGGPGREDHAGADRSCELEEAAKRLLLRLCRCTMALPLHLRLRTSSKMSWRRGSFMCIECG